MRSKRLTKRIEFWRTTAVPDGYGGNTVSEVLITSSWCSLKTFQAGRYRGGTLTDLGIIDSDRAVLFKLRKRNDIDYTQVNMFIKYRDVKYTISSAPVNVDFLENEIVLLGVAEVKKNPSTNVENNYIDNDYIENYYA